MSKLPAAENSPLAKTRMKAVQGLETGASAVETAKFIADYASELAYLSRQANLDLLTYLLDMARLEAVRVVQDHADK